MIWKYVLVCAAVFTSVAAHAESDPYLKLQDMVNDLGGDMSQVTLNNGKTLKCAQGGTKKITIKFGEKASVYSAHYDKCRENGEIRDVINEIETVGEEVVKFEVKPTKNRELFDAVISNDVAKAKSLLKDKADVNSTYSMPVTAGGEIDRWVPLMSAASNANLEMVKLLVNGGAWINYLNGEVKNALWYAVYAGNVDVVKYLLAHKAYVNNSDSADTTPLMVAVMNGDTDVVRVLIARKADVNMKHKDGDSALMFAVAYGNSVVADLLLKAGADLNVKNKEGITPLIICAVENNIDMAKKLIRKGANIDAKTNFGKTALDIATAKGHTQLAQLLAQAATSKNTVRK
ncbi:MAG: hypothetical protein A2076_02050 [Geobacteraceae bacterium GWC2_53_11]|nr:MAG: hypothetical protein A2076_02050 [Geobacteraceae bacterium GWC2_53_11]